ncbi:MAG: DNA lyase [Candidatus Nanohaloarchaea archaeon]
MEIEEIKQHYRENQEEIQSRLKEFRQLRDAAGEKLFKELVFVILTSRSPAKKCWEAAEELDDLGLLLDGDRDRIAEVLAPHDVQYEKNKAGYIVENRRKLSQPTLKDSSGSLKLRERVDPENLDASREQLVADMKGIGWKGASHFLRNIGYGNSFAIVSSRITSKLADLGVLEDASLPSGREEYLEVEQEIQGLAEETGIDIQAFDLVLWSMETGEVFK